MVPECLGDPDENGVYTRSTMYGQMYVRLVKLSQYDGRHVYQWSMDRENWFSTRAAEVMWCSAEKTPTYADKVTGWVIGETASVSGPM